MGRHLLLLPLLLHVAVSLQTGFGGERARRVPELHLPLRLLVLLIVLQHWTTEPEKIHSKSLNAEPERLSSFPCQAVLLNSV